MPKFKTITLLNRNKADSVLQRRFDVHVNADGEFYVNLDEDLFPGVDSGMPAQNMWRAGQKRITLSCTAYSALEGHLNKLLANLNAVELIKENVIRYNIQSNVCFGLDEQGQIVPNGNFAKTKDHSVWLTGQEAEKFGTLHATNVSSGGYSLCIGARAQVKTTFVYGSTKKVSYQDYYAGGDHHGITNPAQRLNSWVGFRLPDNAKEIPYSEDAAIFFFDLMMGLAKLSKLIQDRTFHTDALLETISRSGGLLLGFDLSQGRKGQEKSGS